ncbi:MAG: D-glycero-beta-D-manno-heptose 1,7-bisphosphate 7-phosphatase [Pseudomonadota bacterium]
MQRPRLVILDRDGVINRDSPEFVKSPDEWHALPGSLDAIARLNRCGVRVAVATNQSGVGRGKFSMATLRRMHGKFLAELAAAGGRVETIAVCPHHPDDECRCRKPRPGLLLDVLDTTGVAAGAALAIGDSARDLEAAHAAGICGWLVRTGNGRATEAQGTVPAAAVYDDLAAAVDALLNDEPVDDG